MRTSISIPTRVILSYPSNERIKAKITLTNTLLRDCSIIESDSLVTFFNVKLTPSENPYTPGKYEIITTRGSKIYIHKNLTHQQLNLRMRKHIDLLSGIGGYYEGAMPSGFDTLLAVERSPIIHGFDASLHPTRKLNADINEPIVLTTMLGIDPGLITAAIPQQDYNLSEDLKTFQYPKANALLSVFRLTWLCQVDAIILESSYEINSSRMTNQLLEDLCDLLGWTRNTCTLPLRTVVCATHSRWFTILHSKYIQTPNFEGWPKDTRENARTIDSMPYTTKHDLRGEIDGALLHDLTLNAEELQLYLDAEPKNDDKQYSCQKTFPNLAHSQTYLLSPCGCGCREHPISRKRTLRKGVFGKLKKHQKTGAYHYPNPIAIMRLHGFRRSQA
jgi:hypothetical protein